MYLQDITRLVYEGENPGMQFSKLSFFDRMSWYSAVDGALKMGVLLINFNDHTYTWKEV
jgi:hypothetical protein